MAPGVNPVGTTAIEPKPEPTVKLPKFELILGPVVIAQTIPFCVTALPASAVTLPLSTAVVAVIEVTSLVTSIGKLLSVVKVVSSP